MNAEDFFEIQWFALENIIAKHSKCVPLSNGGKFITSVSGNVTWVFTCSGKVSATLYTLWVCITNIRLPI